MILNKKSDRGNWFKVNSTSRYSNASRLTAYAYLDADDFREEYLVNGRLHRIYGRSYGMFWEINHKLLLKFKEA